MNELNVYCKKLNLISRINTISNESATLEVEVWDTPSQRFDIEYESIDVSGIREQRKMFNFIDGLRQGVKKFNWLIPIHSVPQGVANSNPLVYSTPAGSFSVRISGTFPDDFLTIGDMIQLSNNTKVYTVSADVVGGVNPTVYINQPLRKALTTSESMKTRGVEMLVRLSPDSSPSEYGREAGDLDASFTAEFQEALQ